MKRQRRMLLLSLLLSILLILCGCDSQYISPQERNLPISPDGGETEALPDVDPLTASQAVTLHLDEGLGGEETEAPATMETRAPTESSFPVTDQGTEEGLALVEASSTSRDIEPVTQKETSPEATSTSSKKTTTTTKPATTTSAPTTVRPATTTTRQETTKTTTSKATEPSATTSPKTTSTVTTTSTATTTTSTTTTRKTTTTTKDSSGTVDRTETDKSYKYMGNSKSKVLHLTTCDSASRTTMVNRVYFKTREEAIEAGYTPCGRCKP